MNKIQLTASARKQTGTNDARNHRKEGMVPCVIYGGEEIMHIVMDERQFTRILSTPETFLIEIDVDGTTHQVVLQDIQMHPLTDKVNHADFLLVLSDKAVAVNIPVKLLGQARGVLNGGSLKLVKRKLRLEGLVDAIPEAVEIDITNLRIGQSIRVNQIDIPGVKFLDPSDQNIVAIKAARGAIEDEEEEEGGEEGAEATAEAEASTEASEETNA